jgi:hypothetical protein
MLRDPHLMRPGRSAAVAVLFVLAPLAAGCSAGGGLSIPGISSTPPSSTPPSPTPASSTAAPSATPSFTQKVESFFAGSTATSPQQVAGASQDIECPLINIRQGASTLIIGQTASNATDVTNTNNGAMGVKYQGTFVRAARECALVGGNVVMKIGVQGRIIVGPSGGPGEVNVPLRIAVVDETPNKTMPIVTRLVRIPVTVASTTDNPTFTHVEEGMAFPMPRDLDRYVIYIGFDPLAAAAQDHPKPEPKAKPKPRAKPTTG